MQNNTRVEAERLLGIAEKLLQSRDLNGSRDFAVLAQETEPLLEGSDQILAITDVLIAAERRINNHHDWYGILQIDRRSESFDAIKKQYRRLALLLHPDKNKFAYADSAFKLVVDAWAVLSDLNKKSLYDNELSLFSKVDLQQMRRQKEFQQQQQPSSQQNDNYVNQQKLPVRRSSHNGGGARNDAAAAAAAATATATATAVPTARLSSFWTVCPYCYNLYEYPRVYEACCLRCQNCQRAFTAAEISAMPPLVPGKEAYYCCWAFFPMGFADPNSNKNVNFSNWMPPPMVPAGVLPPGPAVVQQPRPQNNEGVGAPQVVQGFVNVADRNAAPVVKPQAKKRGRPRKYV